MTTNELRDKMHRRAIGLMERARHKDTPLLEATACREKAQHLVKKYELPESVLTAPTPIRPSAARGYTPPERRYPCRFGCGVFVQHTADEMNECATRRRAETGSDSAYTETKRRRSGAGKTFDDFLNDYFGTGYQGSGHHERASYNTGRGRSYTTTPPRDEPRTGSESAAGEPKTKRRQTSHAHCAHEPTKAARARCRKEGGPYRAY